MNDTAFCPKCEGLRPIVDDFKVRVLDELEDGRIISEWKVVLDCDHSGNVVRAA